MIKLRFQAQGAGLACFLLLNDYDNKRANIDIIFYFKYNYVFFRDKKTLLFVIEELLHVRAELCFFLLSLPVLMFFGTFVARN